MHGILHAILHAGDVGDRGDVVIVEPMAEAEDGGGGQGKLQIRGHNHSCGQVAVYSFLAGHAQSGWIIARWGHWVP